MKRFFLFFVFLFVSSGLFAQSWSVWRTIPVFDGERVMPLSSFADQIVKEICGTSRPFLRLDDDVLDGLVQLQEAHTAALKAAATAAARKNFDKTDADKDSIFNYSKDDLLDSLDSGFGREVSPENTVEQNVRQTVENIDPARLERIRQRIELLVPPQGRYFDSSELLLSWLGEPETWNYIPIFDASESDYRSDVLDAAATNKRRYPLRRISVVQLLQSRAYQQRLLEIDQKRYEQGVRSLPTRYDRITERIHRAWEHYQELTFHPLRDRPTRMLDILQETIEVSAGRDSSLSNCQMMWGYLLGIGDESSVQTTDPKSTHPTTERWDAILRRIRILIAAFDQTDAKGKAVHPHLDAVQRQFEKLLELIDRNLDESASFMEAAYPGQKFRKTAPDEKENLVLPRLFSEENRKEHRETLKKLVLRYHYSVKTLRREVETAYLALFDNGRSLRVLPIISEQTIGGDDMGTNMQPWAPLQAVLFGDDVFIRRFFDPQFDLAKSTASIALLIDRDAGNLSLSENETEAKDDSQSAFVPPPETEATPRGSELKDELEQELFGKSMSGPKAIETRTPATNDVISWIRVHFEKLVSAYEIVGGGANWSEGGRRFTESATGLRDSLRETANRIDAARETFVDVDDAARHATFLKTSYPFSGATTAEYRYFRLAPFYWMWVFAACSIGFVLLATLFGRSRREVVESAKASGLETPLLRMGLMNSFEEYVYWTAIAFLLLSVFITFVGGMMRAWITGWAPVTNMYETVVLSAFAAALFGLWYALYPLLYPVVSLAWRLSSFPSAANLISGFTAKKTPPPVEQDGRYAMRQAAADFGVPGSDRLVDSFDDPGEKERSMRRRNELFWRSSLVVPRLILMFLTFLLVVEMCYGEYAHEHGVFAAMFQLLAMNDVLDWFVVVSSLVLVVWFVPHLVLTFAAASVLLFRPGRLAAEAGIVSHYQPETTTEPRRHSELSGVFRGEASAGIAQPEVDNSWVVWLGGVRNDILDRKLYVLVGATIALLAGLAAHYNSTQFNPNIKPLVAVLRSNFWLTVHVIAIILSYAAAAVAWGMSVVALGGTIFGQYRRKVSPEGKRTVHVPILCETIAPTIHQLLRIAVFLLAVGTILGARWADYSWGRFWSWDPKEVWALTTLLFFVIVLHARIGRLYSQFGVVIGGLLGSIAVIMTWYGINFVFATGKHAYGGGTAENATVFLGVFIAVNLLWGVAALGRYGAEVFGTESNETT